MQSPTVPTPTIIVKSARDEETELVANQGEAVCSLYHVEAVININATTVSAITYPVLLEFVKEVFLLPCSSRGPQMASTLTCAPRAHVMLSGYFPVQRSDEMPWRGQAEAR